MTNKHTPGPWLASPESNNIEWCVDDGEWGVAICADAPGSGTAEANARLIAAAPDLLEALQFVMTAHGEQLTAAFEQAQDAIAKATGVQP